MNDFDQDPINLEIGKTFDRRFADFGVSTENFPSTADRSVKIYGFADFAMRRQVGKSGRVYILGIRSAFLEIRTKNCDFHPNPEMDECLQKGKFSEKNHAKEEDERGRSIKAYAKIARVSAEASASGGINYSNITQDKKDISFQYSEYRVRWEASGWRLGDLRYGDRWDRDGIIRGRFLSGFWGTLMPNRGAQEYGAVFRLLLQKGSISITPEVSEWLDKLPGSEKKNDDDAFDGLLKSSAEWLIEDTVKKFENERSELLLSFGHIKVDLNLLSTVGCIENKNSRGLRKPK